MNTAQSYDLTEEEKKLVGKRCSHCRTIYHRYEMMDLRPNRPKKNSYYLHCACLHPGDTILGGAIF